jgi:hypothetical protein
MAAPDISMSDNTKAAMILRSLVAAGCHDKAALAAVIAILEPGIPEPFEREAFEATAGWARGLMGEEALAAVGYLEDAPFGQQWHKALEAWLTMDLMAQVMEEAGLGPDGHSDSAVWFMRALNVRQALLERIPDEAPLGGQSPAAE